MLSQKRWEDLSAVQMLNEQERRCFAELFKKNYVFLMNYATRVTGSVMAAEDAVQDTFYEAMRNVGRFREAENPIGWLMCTLQYKLKSRKRRLAMHETLDIEDCELQIAAAEERFGVLELGMVLDKVFTPHEWTLFYMYYIEGYSARYMAEREGITENNFKVRMHRLRRKVAEELED